MHAYIYTLPPLFTVDKHYAKKIAGAEDKMKNMIHSPPSRDYTQGIGSFAFYTLLLIAAFLMLPPVALTPGTAQFIFILGGLGTWRYSWGLVHYIRALIYRRKVFPKWRQQVDENADALMPSKMYLLITSFRIDPETTVQVFKATIDEAINCGVEANIVASIVEKADETLIKQLFRLADPPKHVKLTIARVPGTGKRDGLAVGFRAISRDFPPNDAVVAVIDGDSILSNGLIRKTAPFFKLHPNLGGLTTDEDCSVKGSKIMKEWHKLRFAQRNIQMGSFALSKKLSTLTGRMSMFRGDIITHPDFINEVEDDHIAHWRFGKLRFLTGDDKSSCFWVTKMGYDLIYVPDALVHTVEHPPSENFFQASTQLMFRWSGNMLRTNARLLKLGPKKLGLFAWWTFFDQRISMWTALSGPIFVAMLSAKHGIEFLWVYLVWIGFTRWIMTLLLTSSRPAVSGWYPPLLYYSQIWGAVMKTYVFFRLNRQSWTRQKTKLQSGHSSWQQRWMDGSSVIMHGTIGALFISIIGILSGVFTWSNMTGWLGFF